MPQEQKNMISELEVTPFKNNDFDIGNLQLSIEEYETEILLSEGKAPLSSIQTLIKLY